MEVPEETGARFKLAMAQPIQNNNRDYPMMDKPLSKVCTFEWTGKSFMQSGHDWDGAREYQLVDIS